MAALAPRAGADGTGQDPLGTARSAHPAARGDAGHLYGLRNHRVCHRPRDAGGDPRARRAGHRSSAHGLHNRAPRRPHRREALVQDPEPGQGVVRGRRLGGRRVSRRLPTCRRVHAARLGPAGWSGLRRQHAGNLPRRRAGTARLLLHRMLRGPMHRRAVGGLVIGPQGRRPAGTDPAPRISGGPCARRCRPRRRPRGRGWRAGGDLRRRLRHLRGRAPGPPPAPC